MDTQVDQVNSRRFFAFALAILSISLLFCQMTTGGNQSVDYYYMIKDGNWILDHKMLPTTNPFSYIPGQKLLMQQWLYMVLAAGLCRLFGESMGTIVLLGISIALYALSFAWFFHERKLSVPLGLFFAAVLESLEPYHNVRPELLTIALLMLEISAVEHTLNTGRKRWLLLCPLLLVLEMNLHGSMWILHFLVFLPYIVRVWWKLRNVFIVRSLPFLLALLTVGGMVPCLFLNPYGLDGVQYLFRSMKFLKKYGYYIGELQPISQRSLSWSPYVIYSSYVRFLVTLLFAAILCTVCILKKRKLRLSDLCLMAGLLILSSTKVRQTVWLDIVWAVLLSILVPMVRGARLGKLLQKMNRRPLGGIFLALSLVSVLAGACSINTDFLFHPKDSSISPVKAVQWLSDHDKGTGTSILCYHDPGAYLEYKGFKVSMDTRPECYSEAIGGKPVAEDTLALFDMEGYKVKRPMEYYETMMERYRSDYVVCPKETSLFHSLIGNDKNYRKILSGNGYEFYEYVGRK